MRELLNIVDAFDEIGVAALATVIRVSSSAYRRPGAMMLIGADGRTWGGISGGCLERDVARRGQGVISTGRAVLCKYETDDQEEIASGSISTGCGGTIELLIEQISAENPGPLYFARCAITLRESSIAVTRITHRNQLPNRLEHFSVDEASIAPHRTAILQAAADAPGTLIEIDDATMLFVHRINPPQELVIFGGGPDVAPVLMLAKSLGWRVTIVAPRPAISVRERFSSADEIIVTPRELPLENVKIAPEAAVILMTHDIERDAKIVAQLPTTRYVGILGPARRTQRIMQNASPEIGEVFAPVGLDLSAETPEEIALSIIAEIQATIRHASGRSLREKSGAIHTSPPGERIVLHESNRCPA